MQLYHASKQWAERPADERFWTLQEMRDACKAYADSSAIAHVPYRSLTADSDGEEVLLIGSAQKARLTHFAFGQLSAKVGAPAAYLRTLPPVLAAKNLAHGLAVKTGEADLLFHANGSLLCRCATSDRYERIWNFEVADRLCQLSGWRTPPARPAGNGGETRIATEADVLRGGKLGLSINVGDTIGPAGIYASDKDMFVFLVDDNHTVTNPQDPTAPLARGFFAWNSEVGDRSFGMMSFLYDAVCGNHIVWGAQEVREVRVRHIGSARDRAFGRLQVALTEYANGSAEADRLLIQRAQTYQLGATKQETLDALFRFATSQSLPHLKAMAEPAYLLVEKTPRYGSPRSPWGIAQAMTQLSQESTFADRRVAIDQEAGKLLRIAF